jgi:hypothetical protein
VTSKTLQFRHASPLRATLLSLAFAAAFGATAAAQAADASRFHVGGTLGAAAAVAKDYDVDSGRHADGNVSWGVFAGVRIADLPIASGWPLRVEVGYQDIADHEVTYRTPGPNTRVRASGHATTAAFKVDAPLTQRISLYGKVGASRNSISSQVISAGTVPVDLNGSHTGVLVAFGGQWDLDSGISLRAEIASLGKSSPNSDAAALTVGVAFRF